MAQGAPKRLTIPRSLGRMTSARSVGTFQAPSTQRRHPASTTSSVPRPSSPVASRCSGQPPSCSRAGAQLRRVRLVECLQIGEEAAAKDTDLTGRQVDAALRERGADLLALPVLDEAREPDEDDHVVADGALGRQAGGQGLGALGDERPVLAAAGRAHVRRLAGHERSVFESDAVAPERLLHVHEPAAHRAGPRRGLDRHQHAAGGAHVPLPQRVQERHLLSQRRERRERNGAFFFTKP